MNNKEQVYITGHKNPDSDSICSALAYADYINSIGEYEAIAVRLGDINKETKFILDYFDIKPPIYKETAKLSIADIKYDNVPLISSDISLKMALDLMDKNEFPTLSVIDEEENLAGLVSKSDILRSYIDIWDSRLIKTSNTPIDNIIDTLSAEIINLTDKFDTTGEVFTLAMGPDSVEEYVKEGDIVILGDRSTVQRIAIEKGVSLMIITGDLKLNEENLNLAKKYNINVISTPYDTYTASRLITQSVPVSHAMSDDIVYFEENDLVEEASSKMGESRYRSYPIVDHNEKVLGMISRYHLLSSERKKFILVDHNERNQSIDGIESAEILEIIDHHRVADVFTGNPIYFRNEPVGSTSTIIASIMFENGRRPSREIAGIMAGAIISDTLLLRSPTATKKDEMILNRLARIAGIDLEEFAMEMFKEGTSLAGKTAKEILTQDFKEYNIKDKELAIVQIFTMDLDSLEDLREELLLEMEEIRKNRDYDSFILMLTDIFKEASEIIMVGDYLEDIADEFGKELDEGAIYLDGVVSRKKQIVPIVTDVFMR